MIEISDEQFDQFITEALDELPQEYIRNMKNVAITIADHPTEEQRTKLKLCRGQTLYGLYEGIPLTQRSGNYSGVLPDKITLFKGPISMSATDMISLKSQIKRTLWHEIAHHYGLNHARIHELENNL